MAHPTLRKTTASDFLRHNKKRATYFCLVDHCPKYSGKILALLSDSFILL